MSIRNLDYLFDPSSVAVIGASERPVSVGATVWRNLLTGGYAGAVYAVNPRHREIAGRKAYPKVAALPAAPDLAIICTPAATVPGLITDLGKLGTRAAIVVTAGLSGEQKQKMLDAARPHLLRVLGPNCIGLLTPALKLNASFAHTDALAGEMAFISQSGALVTAMLDWARARGIGFSQFVSLGEGADVDFGDMLDYLASDARTRSILLYIESISAAPKFMSAARAAARNKPVIIVKAGRSKSGMRAAQSHTGALAGSDIVFDAAIRRAGMLRVDTLQELVLAAETLARFAGNRDDRLTILTNGGGAGVMAADAAAISGVTLADLSEATRSKLDAELPANWSRANPIDIIGDAPVARYVSTLKTLKDDAAAGAILFMHAPTAIVPSAEIARECVPLIREMPHRVLGCWLGAAAVAEARAEFHAAGVPCYDTPEEAVRAFGMLTTYRANQAALLETPGVAQAGRAPDVHRARGAIDAVLAEGRDMLSEAEAKTVLDAYNITIVRTLAVGLDAALAVGAGDAIGYPVALKIVSPNLSHKSDAGGVMLDLPDADSLRRATQTMLERVRERKPDADLEGFTVQAMARPAHARELIIGASIDSVFGPVLLFGAGGTSVEVTADRAVALPPLNGPLARDLISRTRISRLLAAYRNLPAVDMDAVTDVLLAVSQMLADLPEIAELDINPLVAHPAGAIALDARIRVSAEAPGGAKHFAIRPYPTELIETIDWRGRRVTLRPIRPEDEAQHLAFLERLDPEDIRMRIFYSRRSIEHSELARLTQIDYAREMAFVAEAADAEGKPETLGTVRLIADPDNIEAEFGIILRSDLKGMGLGRVLMDRLIRYARERGTQRLVASVLRENARMLELAKATGFEVEAGAPGAETHKLHLVL
ncbi:MAG: bifunctional acetate--CoA ligase family protein/GNAT family N-acetyltransferase [Burkholderiales bacterium]